MPPSSADPSADLLRRQRKWPLNAETRGGRSIERGSSVQPLARGHVMGGARVSGQLGLQLADQAVALGDHAVLVDRLEVLLASQDERVVAEPGELVHRAADHLAHAVLHEARVAVGLLDHLGLVGALHQLVDPVSYTHLTLPTIYSV